MPRFSIPVQILTLSMLSSTALASGQPNDESTINLEFNGGTVAAYVDQIRRKAPDVNIVVLPGAESVEVPAVSLSRVQVVTAVGLLDGLMGAVETQVARLHYDVVPGLNPILRIEAEIRGHAYQRQSTVLPVADLLDGGVEPDALLTAIEAALELHEDSFEPARIRFHRETALLIARGHPDQMGAIGEVVEMIRENAQHWQYQRRAEAKSAAEDRNVEETAERLDTTLAQLRETNGELERSRDENRQMRHMIADLEEKIARLSEHVGRLERQ